MIKVKIYLHEVNNGDMSICLYSKEFGWLEYYDNYDIGSPFVYISKIDMINASYINNPNETKLDAFKRCGKLTYIGEL